MKYVLIQQLIITSYPDDEVSGWVTSHLRELHDQLFKLGTTRWVNHPACRKKGL